MSPKYDGRRPDRQPTQPCRELRFVFFLLRDTPPKELRKACRLAIVLILPWFVGIDAWQGNATAQVPSETAEAPSGTTVAPTEIAIPTPNATSASATFRPLFDGKTLSGWEGDAEWFRIEGDSIVAGSLQRKIPHNFFLCSKEEYGDFELTLEIRLIGEGQNAGVQFRSQRVADSTEVSGYQADAGWAWKKPVWGGIYDESRRRKMLVMPDAEALEGKINPGDWNRIRLIARGPSIQVFVNDHPTADYTETDEAIAATGIIGLQIHSGPPTEAWYRNLRIRTFDSETEIDSETKSQKDAQ